MYNTVNKNYRIRFYKGKEYFSFDYTEGILVLMLNNVRILIVPHYDLDKIDFPPTEHFYSKTGDFPKGCDESRAMSFNAGDLVLFEYPEKENEYFKVKENDTINNIEIKRDKLIYCINNEDYELFIDELPEKLSEINPYSTNGQWQRNDVIHLQSFKFIEEKLHELMGVLPNKIKKSLEL